MANIGEVSRQLYHAIIELNHLFTPPQQRLQFLELIRDKIQFVCNELSRHYLGMAVALPEKQRKIANLSQALQLHLSAGYKLCVLEFLDNGGVERHRKPIVISTHRAISELAATIVCSPAVLSKPFEKLAGVPPAVPVCRQEQARRHRS